jgi:hypothetical protein
MIAVHRFLEISWRCTPAKWSPVARRFVVARRVTVAVFQAEADHPTNHENKKLRIGEQGKPGEVDDAIAEALANDGPVLVDPVVARTELAMLPSAASRASSCHGTFLKSREIDLLGVYVAPISLLMLATWLLTVALRRIAVRFGALRHVWHPALLVFAVYIIVLSSMVLVISR